MIVTPRKSQRYSTFSSTLDPSLDAHKDRPRSNRESPRKKKLLAADRFIPNRLISRLDGDIGVPAGRSNSVPAVAPSSPGLSAQSASRSNSVASETFYKGDGQPDLARACGIRSSRILEFQVPAPAARNCDLRSQYSGFVPTSALPAQFRRKVNSVPDRILDAPGVIDDYYLNLIDWGCSNQLAIALENTVYIWDADTGSVAALCEAAAGTYISSVKWSHDGHLAISMSTGSVQLWDVEQQKKLRSMSGRATRIGVMSWEKHILSAGGRDGSIWHHDVRIKQHKVAELNGHAAEVCGLAWRGDGLQLASGGNDNVVQIWDCRSSSPQFTKTHHTAAVKALAWCPWQSSLLASGGGSQDKHIHFWNTSTGSRVNTVDTGSQVTALHWNSEYREIASCHGFPSNQISLWSYPSLTKTLDIEAHDTRVLYSALSPDGQTLATCAADENLKFWKLFETQNRRSAVPQNHNKDMVIR